MYSRRWREERREEIFKAFLCVLLCSFYSDLDFNRAAFTESITHSTFVDIIAFTTTTISVKSSLQARLTPSKTRTPYIATVTQ